MDKRLERLQEVLNEQAEKIEELERKIVPCEECVHVKSCRKVIILKNRTYKLIRYCSQGARKEKR